MVLLSPVVVLLALTVAVTWGFSPIVEKKGVSIGGTPIQATVVFVLVSVVLYWISLFILLGPGVTDGVTIYSILLFGIAGVIGTALGRIAIFEGIDRVGPSVNSAGISTRPVFSVALAWVFLGEVPSVTQFLGIAVLVLGLVLVSLSDGGDVSGWEYKDLALPIGGAFLFGSGFVMRRFGLIETSLTPLQAVAINETGALLSLLAFFLLTDGYGLGDSPMRSYGYFLVGGVITAVGLLAFFTALSIPEGKVAIVDPIAAGAPAFTIIFSYFLLNDVERITKRLILGLFLTVSGAALVAI